MAHSTDLRTTQSAFDHWAQHYLFTAAHRLGTDILESAVDIHLEALFRQLKLSTRLRQHATARELAKALEFSDSAWIAIDAMLKRLADRQEFLESHNTNGEFHYTVVSEPVDRTHELELLNDQMAHLGFDYTAPLEFLEFGATHFVRALRDDHTFMDRVLTGQENAFADTWHRATNTDPLQDVHGVMGGKAVEFLFEGGTILEVGGGTGNGIRNNLKSLQEAGKLNTLDKYVFTDVSMQFIVNTRKEFKDQYPGNQLEWRLLNINKDFQAQRIDPASANMIYGVNAAHIAQHTVEFLRACKPVLRPGGCLVFAERIRRTPHDMAPREIVLNLSSYHRTAAIRHPEYRPAHAYLAREHWSRACELAGYSDCAVWPDVDAVKEYFPDQYAAVVVAKL